MRAATTSGRCEVLGQHDLEQHVHEVGDARARDDEHDEHDEHDELQHDDYGELGTASTRDV